MEMNGVPQLKPDPRDGDERGKVFVGGLSWDTTNETLLKHFQQWGEVIDCVVMKNQTTGKSRGFGFVKFKEPDCVDDVLRAMPHRIDGREVDPHRCNKRSENKGGKSAEKNRLKIFMGGLPTNVTEEQIQEAFGQFGEIDDIIVMYDQEKQKSRGFGFLSFKDEDAVSRVCQHQYITVAGKKVECKKAEPRDGKNMAGLIPYSLTAGGFVSTSALAAGLQQMFLPSNNFQTLGPMSPMHQGISFIPGSILPNSPLTYSQGLGLPGRINPGLSNLIAANSLNGSMIPGTSLHSPLSLNISNYSTAGLTSPLAMNINGWTSAAALQNDDSIGYVAGGSPGSSVSGDTSNIYDSQLVPYDRSSTYLSSSPSPQSEMHLEKPGYLVYSGGQVGLLGNYSHEASSYGPARFLTQDGKVHTAAGFQSPFANAFSYSPGPAITGQFHGL